MSDKEKVEKENEQFSSSILYVATAVYLAVCAMVFGALYAKQSSLGGAFLVLMKDYGTILAGIPVLVAVIVAKQQMDANRRQHVALVKRGLRDELEVIEKVLYWTENISNSTIESASKGIFFESNKKLHIFSYSKNEVSSWEANAPDYLYASAISFYDDISNFNTRTVKTDRQLNFATEELEDIKDSAIQLEREAVKHHTYLSQYWS